MGLMKSYGVSYFKSTEVEIKIENLLASPIVDEPLKKAPLMTDERSNKGPETAAAAPPVEVEIPHHENEVANLLKLNDEQLVDRLFPDYTNGVTNA